MLFDFYTQCVDRRFCPRGSSQTSVNQHRQRFFALSRFATAQIASSDQWQSRIYDPRFQYDQMFCGFSGAFFTFQSIYVSSLTSKIAMYEYLRDACTFNTVTSIIYFEVIYTSILLYVLQPPPFHNSDYRIRPVTMETRCSKVIFPNYSKKKPAEDTLVPPLWEQTREKRFVF